LRLRSTGLIDFPGHAPVPLPAQAVADTGVRDVTLHTAEGLELGVCPFASGWLPIPVIDRNRAEEHRLRLIVW